MPNTAAAEIQREYGPFAGAAHAGGVTYDGREVWFAAGDRLQAFDPTSGVATRAIEVPARAGTAFDGKFLYQLGEGKIRKIDPGSGRVVASIPAPGTGPHSGLAWAEGRLWVGEYGQRRIHQIDPETGNLLRTLESNRFVTGVTWVDGELWHATAEGGESELRRLDIDSGEVLERATLPSGVTVSGLEWDGQERFYCGGGSSGMVRAVKVPGLERRRRRA